MNTSIEIHVTAKLVDENFYEFSYTQQTAPALAQAGIPGKVVQTGSSMIAPGFAMPVSTGSQS